MQALLVLLNSIVVGVVLTLAAIMVGMFLEAKVW